MELYIPTYIYNTCLSLFGVLPLQMEIFDAYIEDLAKQEKAKEKKSTKSGKEDGQQKKTTGTEILVRNNLKCYVGS